MTTIPPPKFEDLMKRYHGEIERLVDAAKLLCESKGGDGFFCPLGTSCNFKIYVKGKQNDCLLNVLEKAGIPPPYCSPCERTMPECGACKGPAPFVAMSSAELITLAEKRSGRTGMNANSRRTTSDHGSADGLTGTSASRKATCRTDRQVPETCRKWQGKSTNR